MCVIIHKPSHQHITKKVLKKCWDANQHGAGLLDRSSNQVLKGFFNFDKLWNQVNQRQNNELVIHCRIATAGPIDKFHCHPFKINNKQYLFHNGSIRRLGSKEHSDTFILSDILKSMDLEKQIEILKNLNKAHMGRFILSQPDELFRIGLWSSYKGCRFSNMNWNITKKSYSWKVTDNRSFWSDCFACGAELISGKWMCPECGEIQ